jgi:hypothetical protein
MLKLIIAEVVEQELLTLPEHLSSPLVSHCPVTDEQEEFEDTKGKSESAYRRRTDNTKAKRKSAKRKTTIAKTYI